MRSLACVVYVSFLAFAATAHAEVAAYCEAYAIDFANQTETDETRWQLRREDARAACLLQYQDAPETVKAKPKRSKPATVAQKKTKPDKPKLVEEVVKPKPVELAAKSDEDVSVAPTAAKKPDIKEGTPEWYDYCARKYTSFSRKTGKYLSKTGVERKCLVTADFQ